MLFTAKKDGGLRLCIAYRSLNKQTAKHCYPLSRIDEICDILRQATGPTTLNLRSGYLLVRLDSDSIPLAAFCSKYGLFEVLVVPFCLTNAPATSMKSVNDILRLVIDKFVSTYLDGILNYCRTKPDK